MCLLSSAVSMQQLAGIWYSYHALHMLCQKENFILLTDDWIICMKKGFVYVPTSYRNMAILVLFLIFCIYSCSLKN